MGIRHQFVSPKPDDADTTLVNPSDWNAVHSVDPGTIGTAELADGSVTTAKLDPGVSFPDATVRQIQDLQSLFRSALAERYAELTYDVNGFLTAVDVWSDAGKATKLFSRTLTYTSNDLTGVMTTDETTGAVLNRTLTYSGAGDLTAITEVLT